MSGILAIRVTPRSAKPGIGGWRAGAEHVYSAVIGHAVPHLHVHLLPRYPGTPREFWWQRLDEWPDAERGDIARIADLVDRLRD